MKKYTFDFMKRPEDQSNAIEIFSTFSKSKGVREEDLRAVYDMCKEKYPSSIISIIIEYKKNVDRIDSTLYCSFCGKSQHEVRKLISGPTVLICDECSDLCSDIIEEETYSVRLERSLTFPPEYVHAAASVLGNFSRYLNLKYPDGSAHVSIVQHGNKIVMIVKSEKGETEIIEEALTEFGMLITGSLSVSEINASEVEKLQLQAALNSAALQLKITEDTLVLLKEQNYRLLGIHERHVGVSEGLGRAIQLSLSNSNNLATLLQNASKEISDSDIQICINAIEDKIETGLNETDKDQIVEYLKKIHDRKPRLLKEIYDVAKNASASSGGGLLAMWIAKLLGLG